jgi:hypothetical protein
MSTPIAITRNTTIVLSPEEEMRVVRKYAIKYPEVLKILLEHPHGHCQFLTECKLFPCETLNCKYDELSNGYPTRRS